MSAVVDVLEWPKRPEIFFSGIPLFTSMVAIIDPPPISFSFFQHYDSGYSVLHSLYNEKSSNLHQAYLQEKSYYSVGFDIFDISLKQVCPSIKEDSMYEAKKEFASVLSIYRYTNPVA